MKRTVTFGMLLYVLAIFTVMDLIGLYFNWWSADISKQSLHDDFGILWFIATCWVWCWTQGKQDART